MSSPTPSQPSPAHAETTAMPFDRTAGLSANAIRLLQGVHAMLQKRDWTGVQQRLAALLALSPAHPEVLRVRAAIAHLQGRPHESIELLKRVIAARPYDGQATFDLGSALAKTGDSEGALTAFRRSAEIDPKRIAPLIGMAQVLERTGDIDQSIAMLHEALRRESAHVNARNLLARELHFAGRVDEAAREYRRAIEQVPASAMAWYGLSTLRTMRFDADDLGAIEALLARSDLRETDRAAGGFALAKAYEDNARYDEAFRALTDANTTRRSQLRWDAAKFSANARAIEAAFAAPSASSPDASMGSGIVFIVGMPRSGSTLIEQILAAHPDVASGGELDEMRDIVLEESQRRERDFPGWVAQATGDDWHRLGQTYLDRVAQRRGESACFTDKALLNWRYLGAIRAMLPAAKFIDCRRDAVETCLSCFRQMFANELPFTYELNELASFYRAYDRAMRFWRERYPGAILEVAHESLIAEPEARILRVLDFCNLPFDDACLRFHESTRAVRTASAAQVREPLRGDTARAHRYGAALDPLREMLARSDDAA